MHFGPPLVPETLKPRKLFVVQHCSYIPKINLWVYLSLFYIERIIVVIFRVFTFYFYTTVVKSIYIYIYFFLERIFLA